MRVLRPEDAWAQQVMQAALGADVRLHDDWVSDFLASAELADVRAKLGAAEVAERHVFIVVPPLTTAPFGVMNLLWGSKELPAHAPRVPDEITDVWLATTWRVPRGYRWDPVMGCRTLDALQDW